jgi:hypothetical protein
VIYGQNPLASLLKGHDVASSRRAVGKLETYTQVAYTRQMKAVFIDLPAFERHRDDYLDDDGFAQLQVELMVNPVAGDLIEGTGRASQAAVQRFPPVEAQAWRSARDLLLLDRRTGILAIHVV